MSRKLEIKQGDRYGKLTIVEEVKPADDARKSRRLCVSVIAEIVRL